MPATSPQLPHAERAMVEIARRRALLTAGAFAFHRPALAQPSSAGQGPLRFVVPFAPGGGSDLTARAIGARLSAELGRAVVIDNRAGAGIVVGSGYVAKAPPDGSTILIVTIAHAVDPSLQANLPYDTEQDFTPISRVTDAPMVLMVHPDLPARSVAELIALAKARPGTLNYATPGQGSPAHLAAELFKSMAGLEMEHVSYRGAGPATTDLLNGQVQLTFSIYGVVAPHIQSGRLRALAVTASHRSGQLPDLPTVAESGMPGYEVVSWQGVLGPGGMAPGMVATLNSAFVKVLADPNLKQNLARMGYEATSSTPEAFRAFIADEMRRWGALVRSIGLQAE